MRPGPVIIASGGANLASLQFALRRLGYDAPVSEDPQLITAASHVILPGVGAARDAMDKLRAADLVDIIRQLQQPVLGICLGLQLLLERSDEGVEPGLGVLTGRVRRLPGGLKIPHMGWNQVDLRKGHPVLDAAPRGSYFYFVHSYYADPEDASAVAGVTTYGVEFCSAVAWDNVVAVQFHPEKSGDAGLELYRAFVQTARA